MSPESASESDSGRRPSSDSAGSLTATPSGLFVAASGDVANPPTVLVHGSLDRSAGMLKLSRRLDHSHRVWRYDRRGYGRSAAVTPPYTARQHVNDLGEVVAMAIDQRRDAHRDRRIPLLIGHSYGGNVALAFAATHPELVGAVVTYESPLSWLDWWPDSSAGAAATGAGDDPAAAAEAFMRRLIGDEVWARLPEQTRAARRAEGTTMVDELRDLRLNAPWDPSLITMPVLVMNGEHGNPHHGRAVNELAAMLPNATVRTIEGAAHFGPNTHPDAVARAINEFTAGL